MPVFLLCHVTLWCIFERETFVKVWLGSVWNVLVIERFVVLIQYFILHIFFSITLELACWVNAIVSETVDSIHIFCLPETIATW